MTHLARDIAERLSGAGTPTTQAEAERHLKALTEIIAERTALEDGRVAVPGLGIFKRRYRAGRMARNPGTGEPVRVVDGTRLSFRPAKALRD